MRWALDLAGLDYDERQHLTMFAAAVAATRGGRWHAPALAMGARVLHTPDEVLRWVLTQAGEAEPGLGVGGLGDASDATALATELSGRFADASAALASDLAERNRAVFAVFAAGRAPPIERWAARWLGADRHSRTGASPPLAVVEQTFDTVAERLRGGQSFLVGERLSFADVTFAALSAPFLLPPHHPVPHPSPRLLLAQDRDLVLRLREHPAGAFALRVYTARPLSRGSHARQVFVRTRRFFG